MADENIRIKDLAAETTVLSDDDYVMIDSPTNGTSKYDLKRLQDNAVSVSYDSTTKTLTINIGGD